MKYKILIFVFFLFLLLYLYVSHLNQDTARLYLGYERFYENSVADFVFISFAVGVIFSFILGFFFDLKRLFGGWRQDRRGKKREEIDEALEKAKAYDRRGDRDRAVESLQRLIKRSPEAEKAYLVLVDLYASTGDQDRALETIKAAEAALGRREDFLLREAGLFLAKNGAKSAEPLLREVIEKNEGNIEALTLLRDLYVGDRNWAAALDVQHRLGRYVKTEAEQRRLAGLRYEKARETFLKGDDSLYPAVMKEAKDILGDDKTFIPAYMLLADVYAATGKPNERGRVYGRGYSKTGHIIFLLKMEDLYIARGDPGVILKIYRRIVDLSPKDHLILFLYARLCLRLEMIDEAIDTLNGLLLEGESFPGLHRALAEAFAHRGEMSRAVEEYGKVFPTERSYIPFACGICHTRHEDWAGFCRQCSSWGSVNVRKEDFLTSQSADLKAIYEREAFGDRTTSEELGG